VLRSFRLGNHRSFRDEQELLLMPALPGDDRPVVPVAAIYGANASGKSNLLDGLNFMRRAVLDSFSRWDVVGTPRQPFRLQSKFQEFQSVFVVEFNVNGVPYTYGFSLDDETVSEEWLYSYPEKRKRVVFERRESEIKFGATVTEMKSKLEVLEELIRPNALFLSACSRVRLDPLMPAYGSYRTSVRVRRTGCYVTSTSLAGRVREFIAQDSRNRQRILSLLSAADIGITGLEVEEAQDLGLIGRIRRIEDRLLELESLRQALDENEVSEWAEERRSLQSRLESYRRQAVPRWELKFAHGNEAELFEIGDESMGTRSWLELLLPVLAALDAGELVVVDEIDASLHPMLTAMLVGLFRDDETNPNRAQLIFTTHDTSLLGSMLGEKVLDRDQIWFVEKSEDGASKLYPLTDFKPRDDQNTERRYLVGSYGAVPIVSSTLLAEAVLDR